MIGEKRDWVYLLSWWPAMAGLDGMGYDSQARNAVETTGSVKNRESIGMRLLRRYVIAWRSGREVWLAGRLGRAAITVQYSTV